MDITAAVLYNKEGYHTGGKKNFWGVIQPEKGFSKA